MRNVSEKLWRKSKHTFYKEYLFVKNLAVCEIMWKNITEPGRQQLTVWCMGIAR
jgi:hypothetical protein